ncbi:hypothetical protein JCM11491_006908 [Sporobolomyces phaffii]
MITLRIRSPSGATSCSLADDATILDLKSKISEATAIASERQELRTGFPPKAVQAAIAQDSLLSSLGIRSGDTIIVSELPESIVAPTPALRAPSPRVATQSTSYAPPPASGPSSLPPSVEVDGGHLVLRVVPDDNSCLFTAVSLVFHPSSPPDPTAERKIVADTIRSDSFTYSEAILGRPPHDYISTISKPQSWGGAIELAILATHYRTELWSIDVQTGRIDKFGEGSGYQNVVFVVYSGIHYDALTFSFAPPPAAAFPPDLSFDTTIFPLPVDSSTLSAAKNLVESLRKSHAYTDTATFTLRCEVCREAIVGEKEARQHATKTGHQKFGEYDG